MYNHITIPPEFLPLCHQWYGGVTCPLYAIASTGNLTVSTLVVPAKREATYRTLYIKLRDTLAKIVWSLDTDGPNSEDAETLREFLAWTNETLNTLQ